MKRIIIIPGTCAHWSNWFDQINEYESLGYRVDFLELDTYKYNTFIECTSAMFDRIASLVQVPGNNEVEFPSNEEVTIIGHSMGAMMMLKILSEQKYFKNRNALAYDQMCKSKLVFVQVPLKVNSRNVAVLSTLKYLVYPIFLFHRYLIFPWITPLILLFKVIEKRVFAHIPVLRELMNFSLNIALMHNAFWGTRIKEFSNSNKYYRHWDAFSLEGFNAPRDVSEFERATHGHAKNTHGNFNPERTKNYFFTYGEPDFFCASKQTLAFAQAIGAQAVEFTPNNHLPHHMFWNQKKFNQMILERQKCTFSTFAPNP